MSLWIHLLARALTAVCCTAVMVAFIAIAADALLGGDDDEGPDEQGGVL